MLKDNLYDYHENLNHQQWINIEKIVVKRKFLTGKSVLILCAFISEEQWRSSMASTFLEKGALVHLRNPQNGASAFHYACYALCYDLIEIYLKAIDFDLNLKDHNGNTAFIYYLVALGLTEDKSKFEKGLNTLNVFINTYRHFKVRIDVKNKFGIGPLEVCESLGNDKLIEIIQRTYYLAEEDAKLNYESFKIQINETHSTERRIKSATPQLTKTPDIRISTASPSRPSTTCSFLDEIVNYSKVANKADSRTGSSRAKSAKSQRINMSTPISRKQSRAQSDYNINNLKSNGDKPIKTIEEIVRKHLLIDLNEVKNETIKHSAELDDKLTQLYLERHHNLCKIPFSEARRCRSAPRDELSLLNRSFSQPEFKVKRIKNLLNASSNNLLQVSQSILNTTKELTNCEKNLPKTWRDDFTRSDGFSNEFQIVSSKSYRKSYNPAKCPKVFVTPPPHPNSRRIIHSAASEVSILVNETTNSGSKQKSQQQQLLNQQTIEASRNRIHEKFFTQNNLQQQQLQSNNHFT